MAKGEFFSFGDEDVESAFAEPWEESGGSAAVAVADPGLETETFDQSTARAGKGTLRSRGDSRPRSSENRESPSVRVYAVVVIALLVAAVVAFKTVAGTLSSGHQPVATAAPQVGRSTDQADRQRVMAAARARARRAQQEREQAAQRQHAYKRQALRKRRARRRTRRIAGNHRRDAARRTNGAAAALPSAPPTSHAPVYTPTPAPAPASPPVSSPESPPPSSPNKGSVRTGPSAVTREFGL